jgi:hypothetical protein
MASNAHDRRIPGVQAAVSPLAASFSVAFPLTAAGNERPFLLRQDLVLGQGESDQAYSAVTGVSRIQEP